MATEHAFAPYVRALGKGKRGSRSLSQDEARDAMSMILHQQVEPEQLGAFLMLLRLKEETPGELAGFVEAVRHFHNYSYFQTNLYLHHLIHQSFFHYVPPSEFW